MKRIITIQDISCVGKCSLTAALPIISAAGVEASVLPTALLSTHTAFPKFTFRDLTEEFAPITQTFQELGIGFDAIYTGYLGSFAQLELVEKFILDFKTEHTAVLIDPVMGDHGQLYRGFTPEFAQCMAQLCSKADLILPNMTEASFMLQRPYCEDYTEADIQELLRRLTDLGPKRAALTGISFSPKQIGVYCYDRETDAFSGYFNDRLPGSYHGTGDVFASAVVGACTRGLSLPDALALAVDFTLDCIRCTIADPERRDYSVNFEQAIPLFCQKLAEKCGDRL